MKRTRIFAIIAATLTLILILTSCSKSFDKNDVAPGDAGYDGYGGGKGENAATDIISEDRKIIKTVNESVQTDSYDDFIDSVYAAAESVGGYIQSSSYSGESYYREDNLRHASLTVRIPAEKLGEFTKNVESIAIVTSYNENMKDVTAAYVDVESRIAVLSAEESALIEILAKSESVADALTVRTRLLEVQSELASLKAQKNTYDSLIEYSTVYLNVSEVRRAAAQNPSFFEEIRDTFAESVYDIGSFFRSFAVWVIGNVIYLLIVGAAATLSVIFIRRLARKRRAKKEEKEAK